MKMRGMMDYEFLVKLKPGQPQTPVPHLHS
jgi:hypothetical protein